MFFRTKKSELLGVPFFQKEIRMKIILNEYFSFMWAKKLIFLSGKFVVSVLFVVGFFFFSRKRKKITAMRFSWNVKELYFFELGKIKRN
jgi:hypothetical protein